MLRVCCLSGVGYAREKGGLRVLSESVSLDPKKDESVDCGAEELGPGGVVGDGESSFRLVYL